MRWKSKIPYVLLGLYYSLEKIIDTDTAKQIARLEQTQESRVIFSGYYNIAENILNEKLSKLD